MADSSPKKRAGIQSVEIGMHVLDTLAKLGGARPLAAIVKGCGLSPSQTHRYLASLAEAGMVRQGANGTYDLGPAALRLGLSALARIDVFRIADEKLSEFCAATSATVMVAALGPAGPTVVRWHMGRPPIVTALSLGAVLSIVNSATGKVFLAFKPGQETDGFVADEMKLNKSINRSKVAEIKSSVRAAGMAHVGGTFIPGLDAKAFPIFDLQGNAILVATMISLADSDGPHHQSCVVALREVCEEISQMVGISPLSD